MFIMNFYLDSIFQIDINRLIYSITFIYFDSKHGLLDNDLSYNFENVTPVLIALFVQTLSKYGNVEVFTVTCGF
jgi:hypothetical protein